MADVTAPGSAPSLNALPQFRDTPQPGDVVRDNGRVMSQAQARGEPFPWPPDLPHDSCDLRAAIRIPYGDDGTSVTSFFYNRPEQGEPGPQSGATELRRFLQGLSREQIENMDVGIMRDPSLSGLPGSGPFHGPRGFEALRRLAERMEREEASGMIQRGCGPSASLANRRHVAMRGLPEPGRIGVGLGTRLF